MFKFSLRLTCFLTLKCVVTTMFVLQSFCDIQLWLVVCSYKFSHINVFMCKCHESIIGEHFVKSCQDATLGQQGHSYVRTTLLNCRTVVLLKPYFKFHSLTSVFDRLFYTCLKKVSVLF